jgi:hypothetical protein
MIRIIPAVLASLCIAGAQQPAPEQDEPPQLQVRVELLVARLPEAKALQMQPDLRDPARCGAAQERILAMISRKEAELVDWPIVITKSGQRAVTENIREILRPVEYTGANVASRSDGGSLAEVPTPSAPAADAKPAENPKLPEKPSAIRGLPAAFEKRDVGVTMEAEPTINPGGTTVDMQLAPQHVMLLGWKKITVDHGKDGRVTVEQPEFQTIRMSTNIMLKSGQSLLLAFQKPQDSPKQIEVFIVTATVLKVDASAEVKPRQPQKTRR